MQAVAQNTDAARVLGIDAKRMVLYTFLINAVLAVVTGFAMYFPAMPDGFGGLFMWVNVLLGGEYMTHFVHHVFAWFIILFALVHVYMVFREDFMDHEGEASSMFSGVKIFKHEPVDADDVEKPRP